MNKIYEVTCAGTTFIVYDECVAFSQKGTLGFMTKGLAGERQIFYKDISSVQFKKSTALLSGFIEVFVKGHYTEKQAGGLFAGTNNPNRFTFWNRYLTDCEKMYNYIQNKIIECQKSTIVINNENNSIADEIIKFKKLLDDGIITQEEFEEKKKQLLKL